MMQNANTPSSPAVDIWLTKIADVSAGLRTAYRQLLDAAETERLNRFLVDNARDQFLIARALLRTVLSRYAEVSCGAWTFASNAYGKPHIAAPDTRCDLKFSLSHTDGLVACAVSRGHELGVDVENTQRDVDHLDLAPSIMAHAELSILKQLPPSRQRQYFYSVWTLKEAYVKARGMGLSLPLDAFGFDLEGAVPQVNFSGRLSDTPARWQFLCADPTPEHKLALAVPISPAQRIPVNIHWAVPLA